MTSTLQQFRTLINTLLLRLRSLKMYSVLSILLSTLLSWRTLLFLLALINLKSLPLAWHVRLFYRMFYHGRHQKQVKAHMQACSEAKLLYEQQSQKPQQSGSIDESKINSSSILPSLTPPSQNTAYKLIHPVFRPLAIPNHVSLWETDYNFHKSNSTYFSDLDHSRTALVASTLTPTLARNALSNPPFSLFKPGLLFPMLGSVHTSFLREIKPYEAYTVSSRILGWDRKWLVMASYFTRRPRNRAERAKLGDEILLCCSLNKYVVKKGRMTVPPEVCLAGAGWFPLRKNHELTELPSQRGDVKKGLDGKMEVSESAIGSPRGDVTGTATPVPQAENTKKVVDGVERVVEVGRRLSVIAKDDGTDQRSSDASDVDSAEALGAWTWEEIDAERKRGLQIAEKWLTLDAELKDEYEQSELMGLFKTQFDW